MSFAIVFPGQGSQAVGMLSELHTGIPRVRDIFERASAALGYDMCDLVFNGPAERLEQTEYTQPALLTAGIAAWEAWLAAGGVVPHVFAGHSLGEYTALVAAGVLDFSDAVTLVRDRGKYMQEAVPAGHGAMAAILGLDEESVITACVQHTDLEQVSVANYNSPGQIVIAGHSGAVTKAVDTLKAAGAKRAIILDVSVPSHCGLMKPAADNLTRRLSGLKFRDAEVPVIQNVDAGMRTEAGGIKEALVRQLHQPVQWTATIEKMKKIGVTRIIECGPGKVLTGLIRRIDSEIQTYNISDTVSLTQVLNTGAT